VTHATLAERVANRIAERWPGARVTKFDSLPGGHSGITCLAEVQRNGEVRRFVVKATPPGRRPVGRHDVLRQATVLTALAGSGAAGVPEVVARDERDEPFFVMRWYPGEAAEPVLGEATGTPEEVVHGRAENAAAALARLHRVDPGAIGVDAEPTQPLAEFARWTATMATVDPELREGADEIEHALHVAPPQTGRACIVHGDFRLGNILCVGRRASTIIDWEIWSVGDARVDLGWFMLFCEPANFPGISLDCRMPTANDLLARYYSAGAEPVGDVAWFDAMARYKMAAVMGNNLGRHRAGRHHDPFQETLVPAIRAMLANARALVT
jgi:aminoglycoside phosphotransferase (APT) family kinase protein